MHHRKYIVIFLIYSLRTYTVDNTTYLLFDFLGIGVKGGRPGHTGVTGLQRGDNGGPRGALAILQEW